MQIFYIYKYEPEANADAKSRLPRMIECNYARPLLILHYWFWSLPMIKTNFSAVASIIRVFEPVRGSFRTNIVREKHV